MSIGFSLSLRSHIQQLKAFFIRLLQLMNMRGQFGLLRLVHNSSYDMSRSDELKL